MFFESMKSRIASILQRGNDHAGSAPVLAMQTGGSERGSETGETRGTRAFIEGILVAQYNAALAEFDRAKENPGAEPDITTCGKRYMEATARLRKFLAYGEVPHDVVERLNAGRPGPVSSA